MAPTAIETCTICGERFNNTRAGDKHRVIVEKHDLYKVGAKRVRVAHKAPAPRGGVLIYSGGEKRRCLSTTEMRAIGMNQEKSGVWNSGGNWINAPWKDAQ